MHLYCLNFVQFLLLYSTYGQTSQHRLLAGLTPFLLYSVAKL